MAIDRKRPGSIHDEVADPNAATVAFRPEDFPPPEVGDPEATQAPQTRGKRRPAASPPAPENAESQAEPEAEAQPEPEVEAEATLNFAAQPRPSRAAAKAAPTAAPKVAPKRPAASSFSPLKGLLLLVLVLGVAGAGALYLRGRAAAPSKADQVAQLLAQAKEAAGANQGAAAEAAYQAVLALDPGNAEATAGLARAKGSPADQALLDEAQKQLASKQYAEVRSTLRKVPATSSLAPSARALWTQADHDESDGLLAQGMELLKQGKFDEVKPLIEKIKPLDDTATAKLTAALEDAQDAAKAKK